MKRGKKVGLKIFEGGGGMGRWNCDWSSDVCSSDLINHFYLIDPITGRPDYRFAWACTMGIVLALVTLWLTNRFTHPDYPSATETAYATRTGPATMILTGMATGMESTVWAIVAIGLTIIASGIIFSGNVA